MKTLKNILNECDCSMKEANEAGGFLGTYKVGQFGHFYLKGVKTYGQVMDVTKDSISFRPENSKKTVKFKLTEETLTEAVDFNEFFDKLKEEAKKIKVMKAGGSPKDNVVPVVEGTAYDPMVKFINTNRGGALYKITNKKEAEAFKAAMNEAVDKYLVAHEKIRAERLAAFKKDYGV